MDVQISPGLESICFADGTLINGKSRTCLPWHTSSTTIATSFHQLHVHHAPHHSHTLCHTLSHSITHPPPFSSTKAFTGSSLLLTIFSTSASACQFTQSRPPLALGHARPSIPFISRIRCGHTLLFSRVARKREANILGGLSKGSGRRKTAC